MTASRRVRAIATVVAVAAVAAWVLAIVVAAPWSSRVTGEHPLGDFLGLTLLIAVYLTLGTALVLRRPENPISWLLLAVALIEAFNMLAGAAVDGTADTGSTAHAFAAWYGAWSFAASVGTLLVLFHLFPTGRPVASRWRFGTYVAIFGVSLSLVPAVESGEADGIGLSGSPVLRTVLVGALAVSWIVGLATAIPVLVQRYRRSVDAERQQIKWFLYCFIGGLVLWMLVANSVWLLGYMALAMPGIGVAIALLRYHLYDIDRVISRTTSYLIVTALVLGTYGLVVTVVIRVLPASNDLPIAAATLAAAAVARPAVRRVQGVVDRRFDRAKYNGQHEVDSFGARLRHEVNPANVLDGLMAVVAATVRPSSARVWVKEAS